ncbi:putative F-box protein At1g49610 isoform X2 [Silene latifolia]|uniref:putative F-box protein At1g49610 isoform X2 n=1 Tax=Silene latifolia TaxID=37657 RepID=UPI003D76BB7F
MEFAGVNLKRPITGESDGGNETHNKKHHTLTLSRLSELPDLPLVHILSHLYTEEAARTSVLSKRFNSLWNSVDSLTFSDKYSGRNGAVFVELVDAAIRLHDRKFIDKFSLEIDYNTLIKDSVDAWLNFAAQKQVKSVHLNFNKKRPYRGLNGSAFMYPLPESLYKNVNLVELVICCCDFKMRGKMNCSRLKLLSITQTRLNEVLISRILSGCSVLETLELRKCTGFDKLMINSGSLRVLRIVGEQHPNYVIEKGVDYVLEISGPNLVSLEVSGSLFRTKLRLMDLGSLVNAVMSFTIISKRSYESRSLWFAARDEEIAREVLESLCLVKVVTIGGIIIKALSMREAYNLSSPWSPRRCLTLCIPIVEWSHLGLASLLHSSPYLESLVIELSYCSDTCVLEHAKPPSADSKHYWKSWSTISKCRLLHLKTVKVVGFQVSCRSMEPLFHFLEFLLQNSVVLEEIIIHASRYVTRAALDEAMKLLSVPTASPDVVVQFEPPHLWVDPLCMYNEQAPLFLS